MCFLVMVYLFCSLLPILENVTRVMDAARMWPAGRSLDQPALGSTVIRFLEDNSCICKILKICVIQKIRKIPSIGVPMLTGLVW